jgi:hypothetical protein
MRATWVTTAQCRHSRMSKEMEFCERGLEKDVYESADVFKEPLYLDHYTLR